MKCPNCGKELQNDFLFCNECGTPVVKNLCPKCGAQNPEEAIFCSACGNMLAPKKQSEDVSSTETQVNNEQPSQASIASSINTKYSANEKENNTVSNTTEKQETDAINHDDNSNKGGLWKKIIIGIFVIGLVGGACYMFLPQNIKEEVFGANSEYTDIANDINEYYSTIDDMLEIEIVKTIINENEKRAFYLILDKNLLDENNNSTIKSLGMYDAITGQHSIIASAEENEGAEWDRIHFDNICETEDETGLLILSHVTHGGDYKELLKLDYATCKINEIASSEYSGEDPIYMAGNTIIMPCSFEYCFVKATGSYRLTFERIFDCNGNEIEGDRATATMNIMHQIVDVMLNEPNCIVASLFNECSDNEYNFWDFNKEERHSDIYTIDDDGKVIDSAEYSWYSEYRYAFNKLFNVSLPMKIERKKITDESIENAGNGAFIYKFKFEGDNYALKAVLDLQENIVRIKSIQPIEK